MAKRKEYQGGTKSTGPTLMHSWRDIGRLGYGSGGAADSPWARNGIFVQGSKGWKEGTTNGGPGLPLERRNKVENLGQKTIHDYLEGGRQLCLHCHMLQQGHDLVQAKIMEQCPICHNKGACKLDCPNGRLRYDNHGKRRQNEGSQGKEV